MTGRVLRRDAVGAVTLTLDRPDKLNALDSATFDALDAHLAAIEADESLGCVVLRGAGRAFSAGADLGAVGAEPGRPAAWKQQVIERLARLPLPVVAAVHGTCFTGGLELALACDLILADDTARFADTHGKWGFVGAWGISQRLPRRIGLAQAKRLMWTGRPIDAARALAIGLVDEVAPAGGLDALVDGLVADLLANSRHTNRAVKRLLLDTQGMPLAQALAHEHYRHPGLAPDWRERLAAFGGKG